MAEKGVRSEPFGAGSGTRLRSDCRHAAAREIRMHTPYAEANAVRLRLLVAGRGWGHVSAIYEIDSGWAWMLCQECLANEARAPAVGE